MEDRIRSLRALLDETDKRIGAYRREIDRRASEERAYAELGRRRSRPYQAQGAELRPSSGEGRGEQGVLSLDPGAGRPAAPDRGRSDVEPGGSAAAPPASPRQVSQAAVPEPSSASPAAAEIRFTASEKPIEPKPLSFAERVAELHRAGFSSDLIAKRLGATVAEVDLAVALAARLEGDGSSGYRD